MGWTFHWESSADGDFNFDFNIAFAEAEQRAGTIEYNFSRGEHAMDKADEFTEVLAQFAATCGYPRHVHWANAGFLGDELPSERHSNRHLTERALANIRAGDVLMMHLGIWSRKDPFWPQLDPLIAGLKARGLCFATLTGQKG